MLKINNGWIKDPKTGKSADIIVDGTKNALVMRAIGCVLVLGIASVAGIVIAYKEGVKDATITEYNVLNKLGLIKDGVVND